MTSELHNRQKKGRALRRPGKKLPFFDNAVESGGEHLTFCEEEITELLPKNIARIQPNE